MNDYFKNICVIILLSIIVDAICYYISSVFIFKYLSDNLITILLAFLAVNTATLGHLAAKIQDVMLIYDKLDFERTTKEMKKSLFEQIVLILITLFVLIIQKSEINFPLSNNIFNVILLSVFGYAIFILWDTGKSVFVIIDEIRKLRNKND